MNKSLKKLLPHHKHDRKEPKIEPLAKLEDLAQASQVSLSLSLSLSLSVPSGSTLLMQFTLLLPKSNLKLLDSALH